MRIGLARVGNLLFRVAPAAYRPLYSAYKAMSDRRERAEFAAWIRPGDTVLDIGANIGVYASFFAKRVGPHGKVIAFEPESTNLSHLRDVERRFPQVQVVAAAVTSKSGHQKLFVSPDLNVDHRTYDAGDSRAGELVAAVALDEFVDVDIAVSAIKMDIQGAEMNALRGARRLLSSGRRLLLILEYWPFGLRAAGEDPEEMLALLKSAGFELSTVGGHDLPSSAGKNPNAYANLVARRN